MSSLRPLLRRLPTAGVQHLTAGATTTTAAARSGCRHYVTRAHPRPVAQLPILDALDEVLDGIADRRARREERWAKYGTRIAAKKGLTVDGPYRNQDETIELALNLNLDPRKPGQALRGSVSLPHGTGRSVRVVVFTNDAALAASATEQGGGGGGPTGTVTAGGDELVASLASGTVPLTFDRALATPDMMPSLAPVARLLGPRGLMPNAKVGTIAPPSHLLEALRSQQAGQVQYRTDKGGIVHAGIAKGSFRREQIVDNLQTFLNEIQDVKPESFGKGKKGGKKGGPGKGKSPAGNKNAKYYLGASVSSTQGKGVRVDLRTVDPTSAFFMGEVEE
mmetsp:Transcript_22996/g.66380  ORF Transcript_22996/g.66380 Transcript_22996/m.66380 type:complete len:335 (-) Transcript_22996:57-1061(-)